MMEWLIIALLAVFLFYSMRKGPTKGVKSITTSELASMLNDPNKVFIDVRTPGEFAGKRIQQFKNIPLGGDLSQLPHDKEIVVICQSGMRSVQACKQLKQLGYKKIVNVKGGMSAWS
ncbi:rhodanese-like domain-containing protein [Paenibacillus yanchengensis]|uniref:Rhodanese-like domain-containing protein n=1 Tax=Paenibacillus yanchengensis TaxID=2035833 RepID=A0ABW4YM12_9BACL